MPASILTKKQSELLAFLLESRTSVISSPMTAWISKSPRYTAFAEKYKDKIRKKLRVANGREATADLLYELQLPYLLLRDRRFEVEYEPYASGNKRGPDYAITFRTNFKFNIEITHVRGSLGSMPIDSHLVDVLCGKLTQILPNMANILLLVQAPHALDQAEFARHMVWIKERAEQGDSAFYTKHQFLSASDFFKYFQRLSAVVVYDAAGAAKPAMWLNSQAKSKLPDRVSSFLRRGFSQM